MSLTISRTFTPLSGGTISIDFIQSGSASNRDDVTFDVDLSAATFTTTENYDALRALDTTSRVFDPTILRLHYFWSFGDTGHWQNVDAEIPAEYSLKNDSRGKRTKHMFTDVPISTGSAGQDFTVSVLVIEPETGKVAKATTTVNVKNYLFAASRIVLVNPAGDSDFTGFDADELALTNAGWGGALTKLSLASTNVFADTDAAYTTYDQEDDVLWLLKGSETYIMANFNFPATMGDNQMIGAYGTGNALISNSTDGRVMDFVGLATRKHLRVCDMTITGTYDPTTDVPFEPGEPSGEAGVYWFTPKTRVSLCFYNCNFANQGFGFGIVEANNGQSDVIVSLFGCTATDNGGEYSFLIAAADPDFTAIGCSFLDHPTRLIRDSAYPTGSDGTGDVRNSWVRVSNESKIIFAKNRTFLHRWGAGQTTIKVGNNDADGIEANIFFNVMEVGGDVLSFNGAGVTFSSYKGVVAENNIGIGNGRSNGFLSAQADGWVVRNCVAWWPTWSNVSQNQGSNSIVPRWFGQVGGTPATDGWEDNPFDVYGITMVSDLYTAQAGTSGNRDLGENYLVIDLAVANTNLPLNSTNVSGDDYSLSSCVTHRPNSDTPLTSYGPGDFAPDSITGVLTATGARISPKFSGYRLTSTGGTLDTTFDISAAELPTFRLDDTSPSYQGDTGSIDPVTDYLGRRRGPAWSTGCAEDDSNTYVTDAATT